MKTRDLKAHCRGFAPELRKAGHYWQVRCPNCGKRIAYQDSALEACTNWNAQVECERRMKGHEND